MLVRTWVFDIVRPINPPAMGDWLIIEEITTLLHCYQRSLWLLFPIVIHQQTNYFAWIRIAAIAFANVIAVCCYFCSFALLCIGSWYEKACVRLVINDTGSEWLFLCSKAALIPCIPAGFLNSGVTSCAWCKQRIVFKHVSRNACQKSYARNFIRYLLMDKLVVIALFLQKNRN